MHGGRGCFPPPNPVPPSSALYVVSAPSKMYKYLPLGSEVYATGSWPMLRRYCFSTSPFGR
jgi:hypothetical protein